MSANAFEVIQPFESSGSHPLKKTQKPRWSQVPRAEYINPFVESVHNLFSTMLNCSAQREDLNLRMKFIPNRDIVALIGLSGALRGVVAMSFPVQTALNIVSRIYESDIVVVDSTVVDAIAEIVNVVAGGAQAKLSEDRSTAIELSIPHVARGGRFTIDYPSLTAWIEIPFRSELGAFVIRVTAQQS